MPAVTAPAMEPAKERPTSHGTVVVPTAVAPPREPKRNEKKPHGRSLASDRRRGESAAGHGTEAGVRMTAHRSVKHREGCLANDSVDVEVVERLEMLDRHARAMTFESIDVDIIPELLQEALRLAYAAFALTDEEATVRRRVLRRAPHDPCGADHTDCDECIGYELRGSAFHWGNGPG